MKNRTPKLFFQDILESIDKIFDYISKIEYEDFRHNNMIIDAVIRNFEIIGEAAKHIPEEYKEKYPDLPLKEMTGMRNVLIHDYLGIDYQYIWQTIKDDLPQLRIVIAKIIRENF